MKIFVIIAIVFLIIIKNMMKKTTEQAQTMQKPVILDEEEKPLMPEEKVKPQIKKQIIKNSTRNTEYKPIESSIKPRIETMAFEKEEQEKDGTEKKDDSFEIRTPEEARRAIIMSEIINRKY
jgi:hypothetical protein